MSSLEAVFNTDRIREAARDVDARLLDREVNPNSPEAEHIALNELRVASIASLIDYLGDQTVDGMMRDGATSAVAAESQAEECFFNWQAYLNALVELDAQPAVDDLLYYTVAGFFACKPHEVRHALRRPTYRLWLDQKREALPRLSWIERVRSYVTIGILFIVRQSSREDIEAGGAILHELAGFQREVEASWLDEQQNQKREALVLLSLYHLAQAVIRSAEFLLAGSVQSDGRPNPDILPELRRYLVRAEEFLSLAGDPEASTWLVSVSAALMSLRTSSVWIQSRGISERIDFLLHELTHSGRAHPVFSLLPSQQDAIRQAFLDRSRLAIVLQMPTSAGKTLLAEFAIAQTFDAYRDKTRVVYVVPTRALATQTRRTLAEDLGPLRINISAAGSAFEEDPYELNLLAESDGVVVATPEKLDLLLRAHPEWFNSLRLVVVDEAHLLNDGERGCRLELLLANLRKEQPEARLLLLTPFMENADQIATWLSRERGHSINVQWRPSRIVLGLARITGQRGDWRFQIDWTDPYNPRMRPKPLVTSIGRVKAGVGNNTERALFLARKFRPLGTVLAMFSASPADAEEAAWQYAGSADEIRRDKQTPQLRLAIALARHEFGEDARLAACLERGVAYHHSALSTILRYLIEDQVRAKTIGFVAATSTLAQGMNFPVATILVHSVHKPRAGGNFSSSEFWNIAGRAGRVGMVEQGLVVFADERHRQHLERYAADLRNVLSSALLAILPKLRTEVPLKEQYRDLPALRPFIQYLAHAAATSTPARAIANLEELIQQSLANQQVTTTAESQKLRNIARAYLQQLTVQQSGMVKAADQTGLATFNFNELYAKLRSDPVLRTGPREVMRQGEEGLHRLIEALQWIPELNLAIGFGAGNMNARAVAKVVQGWIEGQEVHELAPLFPGNDIATQRRNAARYVYGTVSQNISWGTHAYLRGWLMTGVPADQPPEDKMLPAYMQYGVHSPEAAIASLLGIPRPFAEAMGTLYRQGNGPLTPETTTRFKSYVESADERAWGSVIERSGVVGVNAADIRVVLRQMQGLAT